MDANGNTVALYKYDPYGNPIHASGSLATINPLRYRGYYYDTETGLYYLQSRYYDPVVGRFINADEYTSTGQGFIGFNMFTYCGNNPILNCDIGGNRYIASTSVQNETAEDRSIACQHQNGISQESKITTPKHQEQTSNSTPGTLSLGLSGSLGIGPWVVSGQGCFTIDANGYVAFQYGSSGGLSVDAAPLGFTATLAPYCMVSNAPSHKGLEGPGVQMGVSLPTITTDYNAMLDKDGQTLLYQGISVAPGVSTANFHVTWGNTYTAFSTKFDWNTYYRVTQY